jgi:hypothetical protein
MMSIIYVSNTSENSWSLRQLGLIYKVDGWKCPLFKQPDDLNGTRHQKTWSSSYIIGHMQTETQNTLN